MRDIIINTHINKELIIKFTLLKFIRSEHIVDTFVAKANKRADKFAVVREETDGRRAYAKRSYQKALFSWDPAIAAHQVSV